MSRDERLAARVIAEIAPLFPRWCTVAVARGWVDIAIDGETEVSIGLAIGRALVDRDAVLARNILDGIQDAIVRTSTHPWPPASDPTYLAIPEAAVRNGQLVAWFGSEANPTVALAPMDLSTI